jgi:hypothetical protein
MRAHFCTMAAPRRRRRPWRRSRRLVLPVLAALVLLAPAASAQSDVLISDQSGQILARLLATPGDRSAPFLGTPYGAHTLVGSAEQPERLVVELGRVDCFTFADYVEALKRSGTRDGFLAALTTVRYRDGVVAFANRKHFFTDWAADSPAVATDVTRAVSPEAVTVPKMLNRKDSGGSYLPGLPVVARDVTYLPSGAVDAAAVSRLRPGDYLGAYAEDGGLDVTHVGMFVDTPNGPAVRNASSLPADEKVVDTPLADYLGDIPGIVVLRPVTP